ncbi:MAG: preprotein translocase subunit SecE [Candidatus Sumerlaeota bacterium]|jgi:preprotein translocase subunit SecE|nr:preprotein translocase subunit SecE [Candidatus Sumerlaeota bacterium]
MNKIRQWYEKISNFLKDVKVEMKKVTWPSRDELVTYTVVVIVVVFILSVYIGVIDKVFGSFLELFLRI